MCFPRTRSEEGGNEPLGVSPPQKWPSLEKINLVRGFAMWHEFSPLDISGHTHYRRRQKIAFLFLVTLISISSSYAPLVILIRTFLRRNSAWHWYTCEKGSIRSFSSRAIEPKNDNKKGELRELSRIWNQVVTICVPFRVLYLLWWSRSTTTRWHQFISFFYPLSYTHKKVARAHIKTA